MSRTFRFDTGGKPLAEIAHTDICMQAAFRLDTPIPCTPDDIFELRDGAWFKLEFNGEDVQRQSLSGRWVMPKVTLIPEKDIKHVRPVKVYVKGE